MPLAHPSSLLVEISRPRGECPELEGRKEEHGICRPVVPGDLSGAATPGQGAERLKERKLNCRFGLSSTNRRGSELAVPVCVVGADAGSWSPDRKRRRLSADGPGPTWSPNRKWSEPPSNEFSVECLPHKEVDRDDEPALLPRPRAHEGAANVMFVGREVKDPKRWKRRRKAPGHRFESGRNRRPLLQHLGDGAVLAAANLCISPLRSRHPGDVARQYVGAAPGEVSNHVMNRPVRTRRNGRCQVCRGKLAHDIGETFPTLGVEAADFTHRRSVRNIGVRR